MKKQKSKAIFHFIPKKKAKTFTLILEKEIRQN